MKVKVFTIRDDKMEQYNQPFFVQTIGAAEREFTDLANNPDQPISRHAEDYTLFLLGEYNQADGSIEMEPTPKPLIKGIEVKNDA